MSVRSYGIYMCTYPDSVFNLHSMDLSRIQRMCPLPDAEPENAAKRRRREIDLEQA